MHTRTHARTRARTHTHTTHTQHTHKHQVAQAWMHMTNLHASWHTLDVCAQRGRNRLCCLLSGGYLRKHGGDQIQGIETPLSCHEHRESSPRCLHVETPVSGSVSENIGETKCKVIGSYNILPRFGYQILACTHAHIQACMHAHIHADRQTCNRHAHTNTNTHRSPR